MLTNVLNNRINWVRSIKELSILHSQFFCTSKTVHSYKIHFVDIGKRYRHFTPQNIWITIKHLKKCSLSPIIRKMLIEITVMICITLHACQNGKETQKEKGKKERKGKERGKNLIVTKTGELVEQLELSHTVGEKAK